METRGAMEALLEELRSQLVPGAYAAAEERGRRRHLDAMLAELLAVLDDR
jgi:hypothetical protein